MAGAVVSGLAMAAGSVLASAVTKPKKPKATAVPRAAPQLRQPSVLRNAIIGRHGAGENKRTGMGGAEAPAGAKSKLGM